jgi:hypothetical protein
LLVLFVGGVLAAYVYRRFCAGVIALSRPANRPWWHDFFDTVEFVISLINISIIAGLLAGITIQAKIVDLSTAATFSVGVVAIGVMLMLARAFPRLASSNRPVALLAATFGGGNRGYVLLQLMLGILAIDAARQATIIATYFLVDFGNFLIFLGYFSFFFRADDLQGQTGAQIASEARRNRIRGWFIAGFSFFSFLGGTLLSAIPTIEPALPTWRDRLSVVLLLLATFNMFVALGRVRNYKMERFRTVLVVFFSMRVVGGLVVTAFVFALYYLAVGLFGQGALSLSLGAMLIAIIVLFYSPPSSLIGDMFAVRGVEKSVTEQVKSDAAILNLCFVVVLVAAAVFIAATSFAALKLP